RYDEDKAGGNWLREMFGDEQGIAGKLEQMVTMRTARCVLEVDGVTRILGLNQQIEFAADIQSPGIKPQIEMTFTVAQAILPELSPPLQSFDGGLRHFALLHLVCGLSVESHHVLIKRNARTVGELIQVGDTQIGALQHPRTSSRHDLKSSSHIG